MPSPDFDGGSGHPRAWRPGRCPTGRGSVSDGRKVRVEPLRRAVDRTDDAGDRDELFADLPKGPVPWVTSRRTEGLSVRDGPQVGGSGSYCFPRSRLKSNTLSTRAYPVPEVVCGPATSRSGGGCLRPWRGCPGCSRGTRQHQSHHTLNRPLSMYTQTRCFPRLSRIERRPAKTHSSRPLTLVTASRDAERWASGGPLNVARGLEVPSPTRATVALESAPMLRDRGGGP